MITRQLSKKVHAASFQAILAICIRLYSSKIHNDLQEMEDSQRYQCLRVRRATMLIPLIRKSPDQVERRGRNDTSYSRMNRFRTGHCSRTFVSLARWNIVLPSGASPLLAK